MSHFFISWTWHIPRVCEPKFLLKSESTFQLLLPEGATDPSKKVASSIETPPAYFVSYIYSH